MEHHYPQEFRFSDPTILITVSPRGQIFGVDPALSWCNQGGLYLLKMSWWAVTWQNQQNGCAPSKDSDQPGHLPSMIRVFAVHMKKAWVLSYPLSALRRLWSDWADAQADLSLRWVHTYFVGFVMSWLRCLIQSTAKSTKWLVYPAKTQISLWIRCLITIHSHCAPEEIMGPWHGHAGWCGSLLGAYVFLQILLSADSFVIGMCNFLAIHWDYRLQNTYVSFVAHTLVNLL